MPSRPERRPAAVLIGAPGAGKTTVGRLLAGLLGVGFRDTDADLEASAGTAIPDILHRTGEAHFRLLERAAVHRALARHAGVLALGGGSVLDASVQQALRSHTVVHLAVPLEQLLDRIGDAASRPLLADDPGGRLRTVLGVRTPIYRRLARHTVTVAAGERPDEVAGRIAALLPGRPAGAFPRAKEPV
ncbi:shikimate kinase [Streptomyces sp. NPDC049597]|uniref:shikimate kinase n=1 Tax=Streptomyces sp. NPDC049597 TaxID=3155276 RepID=UPI00343407EE